MADIYEDAAELFGFDSHETDNLLDELEEQGFDYESDSLRDDEWANLAAEAAVAMIDEDDFSDYTLDEDWEYGEDEWLDAGIEVELTTEYEEAP